MFDGVARRSEADWTRTLNSAVAAGQLRGLQSRSSLAADVIKAEQERASDAWSLRSVRACERCEAGDQVGISERWVIYELMPFGNWKLAGDE